MKKSSIKAFTLVEMLIVIVIIGILIAALMPRMQAAQGRARDVSRKTALSQVQTAIVTYQGDKGVWPGTKNDKNASNTGAASGISITEIGDQLQVAGMNSIPEDPNNKYAYTGLGGTKPISGYQYLVTTRNGVPEGGFVLMAQTEVEGGSNWVVCSGTSNNGIISGNAEINTMKLCQSFYKSSTGNCSNDFSGNCVYSQDSQLRYVLFY